MMVGHQIVHKMMEYQNLERVNFIKTLSTLIESATSLADGVLHDLGWTREKILEVSNV